LSSHGFFRLVVNAAVQPPGSASRTMVPWVCSIASRSEARRQGAPPNRHVNGELRVKYSGEVWSGRGTLSCVSLEQARGLTNERIKPCPCQSSGGCSSWSCRRSILFSPASPSRRPLASLLPTPHPFDRAPSLWLAFRSSTAREVRPARCRSRDWMRPYAAYANTWKT